MARKPRPMRELERELEEAQREKALLAEMERRDSSAAKITATTIGTTQFQDLKALLKNLEAEGELGDKPPPFEIQERVHTLCRKFLGGTWKDVPIQDLLLTRMKGGMSNMLFLCQLPPDYAPRKAEPDKVLLRVYFNPETESHLVAESVIFTLLSERALGPQLFGIFNGGRLEEYIVSRPLKTNEIRDPIVSRRIAKKVARVHGLSVPIEKDGQYLFDALNRWLSCLLEEVDGQLRDCLIPHEGKTVRITAELLTAEIDNIRFLRVLVYHRREPLESVPVTGAIAEAGDCGICVTADWEDPNPALGPRLASQGPLHLAMEELQQEAALLEKCILRSHSPVVFCHNDLQEGNILLPKGKLFGRKAEGTTAEDGAAEERAEKAEETEEPYGHRKRSGSVYEKDLVLIDFEYASYNYRGFDFANHFAEMSIDYSSKVPPYFNIEPANFPNEEAQKIFFHAYLEQEAKAYREGQAEMYGGDVDDVCVQKLVEETRPFVAVSHFFWGVWALLQLEVSPIEFGFEEYARARLAGYFAWRGEMLKLLEQDPPPRSPIPSRNTSGDKNRPPPPPLTGFSTLGVAARDT